MRILPVSMLEPAEIVRVPVATESAGKIPIDATDACNSATACGSRWGDDCVVVAICRGKRGDVTASEIKSTREECRKRIETSALGAKNLAKLACASYFKQKIDVNSTFLQRAKASGFNTFQHVRDSRLLNEEFFRGNKGALRIPSLSFQYVR